ncbi:MarC family protein [Nitrospira sp. M1]
MTEKFIRDALILWTTIDPIGTLAIFTAITGNLDAAQRKKTAIKAICYSAAILLGAIIIGQVLLSSMGIRLLSLQVAGGIILFLFGLQMVFGSGVTSTQTVEEPGHDIAVFPLAVPSIATPGAILAVILLTDNHLYSIPVQVMTSAILLGILAITLVCMLAATPILKVIGMNGASIMIRVMGMILAALSTEFVMEALHVPQWIGDTP